MFKPLNILDEKHKVLRKHSEEVKLPLSKEDKDTINQIITHLKYSQIEKLAEKYDVEMPIVNAAYDVLYNNLKPQDAVNKLMTRAIKFEKE